MHGTGRPLEDRALSPFTGYTRSHWAAAADNLLHSVRPFASPSHALITLPGATGGFGTAIDGLEGFARTFMAAGFRLHGERGVDPLGLAEWYAEGLDAGTNPNSDERWTTTDEHRQAKVESAAIALTLHLTKPWIWDRLDDRVQQQIITYLARVIKADYPPNNWLWFRVIVEQFLRSVGGPWDRGDLEEDLARHDSFAREDGWYTDGHGRNFDHYTGWALHFYPILWLQMAGDEPLARERTQRFHDHLDRYLEDAKLLVGANGGPLIQGRSLTYRYATAAPFWVGAMTGSSALTPGLARRAASGILKHFTDNGVPDHNGLLNLGWFGPWRPIAQSYSGTGSPYWASKGMLGLALPADHDAWTAVEKPLPIEIGDVHAAITAPGWIVSGTRADGIVRVINHGTDHAEAGKLDTDSPLYARFGYSTATSPVLARTDEDATPDQSVLLFDEEGRPSHRTGFERLSTPQVIADTERTDGTGSALLSASRCQAHWVIPHPAQPDLGWGHPGHVRRGHSITTVSLVRNEWEVRFVKVDATEGAEVPVSALRVTGWCIRYDPGEERRENDHGETLVHSSRLLTSIINIEGFTVGGVDLVDSATPLSATTAVPWRQTPTTVEFNRWYAVALVLTESAPENAERRADGTIVPHDAHKVIVDRTDSGHVSVRWPDRTITEFALLDVTRTSPAQAVDLQWADLHP